MNFETFSPKQLKVLTWWCRNSDLKHHDAIICDGAVRSGKTICMSVSFVAWAMGNFNDTSFALCGKTVTSLRRNVITPLLPVLADLGFTCKERISKGLVEIEAGNTKNRFYLFGGRDESSASLIQGLTLGGILLDEVALMPRSFVEQGIARCSVTGSKLWFNCNPENPHHWFHNEWIKKAKEKNCLYLHFVMQDNPSLSQAIIERYHSLYSGSFFERFVEGKWVAAEGLVYQFFNASANVSEISPECSKYYISCDYGTVNPCSMGLWGFSDGTWYRIDERYWSSKREGSMKTDEEYYDMLCELAGNRIIEKVIIDPSAVSFIECIRRHGKFSVIPAKNDVNNGIRRVSESLKSGKIKICSACKDILREFELYRWDNTSSKDSPKKEHDHAMDDMRYFVSTVLYGGNNDGFAVLAAERN